MSKSKKWSLPVFLLIALFAWIAAGFIAGVCWRLFRTGWFLATGA